MRRPSLLLLGAALSALSLGGCGSMDIGGDARPAATAPGQQADATGGASTMAPDVEDNLHQMQLLRANNDLVGATRIISQLMLVYPDDPRVVGEYGKLLVQENRSDDAVQFLRRAIELKPGDWTLYSALGVAFDQANDHTSAKLAYERALAVKPGEPAVLNNYAMSRMMAGDTAGARTLLLQAKASGATDPKIDRNLALLDKMPVPAAAPAPAYAAAGPRKPVATVQVGALPAPGSAHGAPTPLARSNVVMQAVPSDPLAGPVAKKPSRLARVAAHKPSKVAASTTPAKKPAKPGAIPSLRMTADAGKP